MKKNKISKVLTNNGYAMKSRSEWMKRVDEGHIYVRVEDLDDFLGDVTIIVRKRGYKEDGKRINKIVFNGLHLNMILKIVERKSKIKEKNGENIQTVLIDKDYFLLDSDNSGAEYYRYKDFLNDTIQINVKIKKDIIKIEGRIIGLSMNFETVYKGSDFEEFYNVLKEFEEELKKHVMEKFDEKDEYDD